MGQITVALLLIGIVWGAVHISFSWISVALGALLSGLGLRLGLQRPLYRGAVLLCCLGLGISLYESLILLLFHHLTIAPLSGLVLLGMTGVVLAVISLSLPRWAVIRLRLAPGEQRWLAHLHWGFGGLCGGLALLQGSGLAWILMGLLGIYVAVVRYRWGHTCSKAVTVDQMRAHLEESLEATAAIESHGTEVSSGQDRSNL